MSDGLSAVVPVFEADGTLVDCVEALARELAPGPFEILLVDDRSGPRTRVLLAELSRREGVRLVDGAGRGAAAALELGFRAARYPVVAQVDQDVVVQPGWLAALVATLDEDGVAAAQGAYAAEPGASIWARVTALDLEARWRTAAGGGRALDHVCTGNTLYRRDAVLAVGGFDPALGYGYDNDLSYRLVAAGHRLALCRGAVARHRFADGLVGYFRRQLGQGHGRLDLVRKHPTRLRGDRISGLGLMLRPPATLFALAGLLVAPFLPAALAMAATAGGLLAVLVAERSLVALRILRRTGDRAALALPLVHLVRDLAWATALARWTVQRLVGTSSEPGDSMPRRRTAAEPGERR